MRDQSSKKKYVQDLSLFTLNCIVRSIKKEFGTGVLWPFHTVYKMQNFVLVYVNHEIAGKIITNQSLDQAIIAL